jgi:hypothetical protein
MQYAILHNINIYFYGGGIAVKATTVISLINEKNRIRMLE